jgi:hypothetical protein
MRVLGIKLFEVRLAGHPPILVSSRNPGCGLALAGHQSAVET